MYTVMIVFFFLAVVASVVALYLRRQSPCTPEQAPVPATAPPVVTHKVLAHVGQRPRNRPDATSP